MGAKLVLNETKKIKGAEYKAGTVIAEVECAARFTVDDVNRGLQLNQLSVVSDEKKAAEGKPATGKTVNGKPGEK